MSGKFGLVSGKVREMSGNFVLLSLYEPCNKIMSKSKSWQIMVHFARGKKMIKKTSSNQSCGKDSEYKMVRF